MIERSAENLLFCIILIIWAVNLRRRILDAQIQKILISLAMSIVFLFGIRTAKYTIFDKNTILWYMYYIPLTMMPLMVFFMAKRISGQQASDGNRFDRYLLIGLVFLNGMILTNDLHQLVFRFTTPGDIDTYTYGMGYIITIVWIATFVLLALYRLYRVCSLPQSRSKIWVPVIPLLMGMIAIVIDIFHMVPMINNTKIYQFQEIVLLMVIFIVEACIQIGIIPSNDGYEEIFTNSKINACITDHSNQVVYSSDEQHIISEAVRREGNTKKIMLDAYTRLHASAINGGVVYYTEDIQEIVKLNHMLEEAAEVISAEKEMIEAENQLLADETMYKTKNRLYDDIARIVRPQVLMIEECLTGCEQKPEAFDTYMSKAMVLNAYIKRRINLSLIAMEQEQISLTEISLAIAESLTYLNYSKISTSILNNVKNKTADADCCIKAYDAFEELLEAYYEKMSACMVTIDEKMDQTILRMTVETTVGASLLSKRFNAYEVFEGEDMIDVTISLLKGGGAL
ncbi:MAG: histidine kinase N-terminal 7TM domain-containing protein [Eubacteriales bacterium]|nr:histidine kinase N-terminal 7TM domain-containing protein [Eubacteriales bacterium]